MKNLKLKPFLAALLFTTQVFADAVIFSGSDVKSLKPNLQLFDQAKIMSGTVTPSSSATSANTGSLYLNTSTGLVYRKTDNGSSTNWTRLADNGVSTPLVYTSATGTYAIQITDDIILCSSSSFTATLPTAVGNSGKVFTIQHGGTSITQVYTLATTSAQTIGGIASGSYALYTAGESLTIYSDGANWVIREHKTKTDWSSTTTITIGSVSNPQPTKASTATIDSVKWRRLAEGRYAEVEYLYSQPDGTGASNGTGNYVVTLPSIGNVDTGLIPTYVGSTGNLAETQSYIPTFGGLTDETSQHLPQAILFSTSQFRVRVYSGAGTWGATTLVLGAKQAWRLVVRVPISGWQP